MKADKFLNHTTSHLLAAAIFEMFPNTKFAFGPAIDEGFYYDFEFSEPLSDEKLVEIEKRVKQLAKRDIEMIKVTKKEFDEFFKTKQPYKEYMLDKLQNEGKDITFYSLYDKQTKKHVFVDLCAGGHIENVKPIKYFKLLSLAGAYWLGDSNSIQLTRIYGTSWYKAEELKEYEEILKNRRENDHRQLNKTLNVFGFDNMAGQGFPFWYQNGMKIRNAIRDYVLKLDKKYGFTEVLTPHFGSIELYKKSGHLSHYKDDMFKPLEVENEKLIPRPMTCPHHILIYQNDLHSYRDLPIRFSEQSRLYRYEKSGALTGLERVRSMDLTEGHLFVTPEQIEQEVESMYKQINEILSVFKIQIDYISLSLRDKENKEKFFPDDKMWDDSEAMLERMMNNLNIKYEKKVGEAAFYGPKIDIQIKTLLNHEITVSTIQLDFLLPRKFDISYIDKNNEKQIPVMIHRGLIGTYERFISVILEQYKGNLPLWLAPNKIQIIPVVLDHKLIKYANKIKDFLASKDIDANINLKDERLPKKVREAHFEKYKYQIILGENEMKSNTISYREYGNDKTITIPKNEFAKLVLNKIKNYE
ncbi:Threonine--tRNA ligase [Mycoplasmopsis californica]|uniref:Threonine--tRNA ligase n=1 Tax=Mycoplasmopsis equigenitalium TaxID=114883 RepID=A0ABY5J3D1_9BACT|nr:threonine--tRNA ligase [Mycoplasmopsis equigenitalium]UUD37239.1 threonine--tRNA ligase [Mycoplasmopsis equigenitalium]VEU69453.1 Threonine--tRNA ligase [Mycoplasmopsis californica]